MSGGAHALAAERKDCLDSPATHWSDARVTLATFVTSEPFSVGETITLGEREARHIRVLRLAVGARLGLRDGRGMLATAVLVRLAKRHAAVTVEHADMREPPSAVHLLLPVADRDRMMWLAEKATELGVSSWRPVLWKRSRSVQPRGEGPTFTRKVAARMEAALEQSRGTWMPIAYPDALPERAIAATPDGLRLLLDLQGVPIARVLNDALAGESEAASGHSPPVIIVVGPEGGLEPSELSELREAGFRTVSLGRTILRFETAAVAALAVVRSFQMAVSPSGGDASSGVIDG